MRLHSLFHFLTLVLVLGISSAGFSAPESSFIPEAADPKKVLIPNDQISTENTTPLDSTQPSQTAPPPEGKSEGPLVATRRAALQTHTITLGYWSGPLTAFDEYEHQYYAGYVGSFYRDAQLAQELTLEGTQSGLLGWSAGFKWIQDLGRNYEPFYKVALGALYKPGEGIGTLINWNRYQVRASVGVEDLFRFRRHFRGELGGTWSGLGLTYFVNLGYAF
ncbi:MAG: hypothetical protein BroJett040_22100 [Oligoflexia bacterium]|nr:MAG: hypothetical protein BroJett040_22100 [Oligoflexia bacterium]